MALVKSASAIALSAAAAAMISLTGCGSSGGSSSGALPTGNPAPVENGTTTLVPATYTGSASFVAPATTSPAGTTCDDGKGTIDAVLPAEISVNTVLDNTVTYGMTGKVKVTSGATLQIPAGTTIAGCIGKSYMIVTAGSKLDANGTLAEPIAFTSLLDVNGSSADNKAGEWGGLILLGGAWTHYGTVPYEADPTEFFGNPNHDYDTSSSGSLKYVLVKHSGFEVEKDKELNGLSLGGVGSGTVFENVAIVGGLDDGIEIWGGTANINKLYVYNAADDSVDTDLGYRGTITDVLVRQVNVDKTNNHDSAGMEFGNDGDTITTDKTNATMPFIKNYTAYIKGGGISNKYDAGFKWDNVMFISDKTVDTEQIDFRGEDSYTSDAKEIISNVCFFDTAMTLENNTTFSLTNAKDTSDKTAYNYFVTNVFGAGGDDTGLDATSASYLKVNDNSCTGVTEANIWKGHAGDNAPLEAF